MIHNEEYIKELMRKRFEKTISPKESALLRAARRLYDEDEWLGLTAGALADIDRTQQGTLPHPPPLNLAAIRQAADKKRRGAARSVRFTRIAAAAILLAVIGWGVKKYWDDNFGPLQIYGGCIESVDGLIPAIDFKGTVAYGHEDPIVIGPDVWGDIIETGNLSIRRDTSGVVVIDKTDEGSIPGEPIRLSTGVAEQLEARFPNGVHIRLNEETVITYTPMQEATLAAMVDVKGTAHVQVPQNGAQMEFGTANSRVYSDRANFVVIANEARTALTLLDGALRVVSQLEGQEKTLLTPGDRISVETVRNHDGIATDIMLAMHNGQVDDVLQWAQVVREYRDVPLSVFIKENEGRFNIRFRDLSCLPKGKQVSAALCYRASLDDFLAVIENHGVLVYKEEGQYTLCDPKTGKRWTRSTATAHVADMDSCQQCGSLH